MLETLGKRAMVAPFVLPVVLCCILGLALTPILRAQATDIPFAVVTLDKGSALPISDVNIGDQLAGRLMDGEGLGDLGGPGGDSGSALGDVSIAWTEFGTEQELRDALAANEFYGGVIIPEDFTAQQMMAATGLGGAPTLTVLLNTAKNPSLAQQMGPNMKSMLLRAGISVEVEEVNAADIGGGSMAPMMAVQMIVMPLFIMTLIGSILLSAILWPRGAARRGRTAALARQLVLGAVLSGLIALLGVGVDAWFGGLDLPLGRLYPFIWLAVGAMMLVIVGLCDLALPLGALVGITAFALGMGCAMLAPEMLPPFWREWVYPWVPQHFLGDGVRAIVYLGADALSTGLGYWMLLYGIGAAAMALALLAPRRRRAGDDAAHEASTRAAARHAALRSKAPGFGRRRGPVPADIEEG